ncbi:formimidoylglutamate deiminase [Arboricoccus pini]|uniref:Formimidoylglutamate deiminase n=1 Tax=Arboricoccus pini TaxID=1963835 RepID=A0A212RS47_9PROT|nr:formimidoylglutamate deiminase [Arboricoccus pini]
MKSHLYASEALLPTGWAKDVRLTIDEGRILEVVPNVPAGQASRAAGPVLPAMGNLHSHAFQRAMAGLAERAADGSDSFWTWREAMYRLVGLLQPDEIEAVSAKLYLELLKGGFSAVAEFHYLHHQPDGRPYADPAELSRRVMAAAGQTGIGLTLLPVFYAHGDFGGQPAAPGQARFVHDVEAYLRLLDTLEDDLRAMKAGLGMAFHSLRAATPEEIGAILAARPGPTPTHIHVAEQPREVEACLAWSGRRPVRFLMDVAPVDANWCLVHATHMDEAEMKALAASGAVVGLCPMTEANLGDGLFPATAYRQLQGAFGIGTDSHVATDVASELQLLELGQRLRELKRNRLADGPGHSVGRSLYEAAGVGAGQALARGFGLAPGMPADFLVLDGDDPFIQAASGDQILDRWIFALGQRVVRDVMVAGRWRIRDRHHAEEEVIDRAFARVLRRLADA